MLVRPKLYYKLVHENVAMGITSIRLADDINKPLEVLASKLDRSKNYLINQAIKEFLARQSV